MISLRHACASLALAAALNACMTPSVQTVLAPDGHPALFVECGADEGACFALAGQSCPQGYDIRQAVTGQGGSYLVRCRYAPTPMAQASPPAVTPAPPPYNWPPASVPATQSPPPSSADVPTATFPSGQSNTPQAAPRPTPKSGAQSGWPPPNEPGPTALPWEDLDLGY